eukprot:SAG11_NODE_38405_length_252_cov_1.013072_1_plen_20_part_01
MLLNLVDVAKFKFISYYNCS